MADKKTKHILRIEHKEGVAYVPPFEIAMIQRGKKGITFYLKSGASFDCEDVKDDVIKEYDKMMMPWFSPIEEMLQDFIPEMIERFKGETAGVPCPSCGNKCNGIKCELCEWEKPQE